MKGGVTGYEFSTCMIKWFPDNVYFKNVDLRSLSQYGVCFLATTLFMQYVILRVALHEVLIVIALGHVDQM